MLVIPVVVPIPTVNFLGYVFNELSCNLELTKSFVDKSELNSVREPGVVTNEHLYMLNFKSWVWVAVQIVPFWDLNKLPPRYCLVTILFDPWSTPSVWVSIVSSPIWAIHILYAIVAGARMTIAYSLAGSKYIGDGKVTLVANEASVDVFTTDSIPSESNSVGSKTTSA